MGGPLRIPLSWTQDERTSSTAKDTRRVNVLDEYVSGQPKFVTKRSGLDLITSVTGANGQGLSFFNNVLYGVIDDVFTTLVGSPPFTGTDGTTWASQSPPPWSSDPATPLFYFSTAVLNGALYVIGGFMQGSANYASVWSTTGNGNWRQCTGSPAFGARDAIGCAVFNGTIYVMGGVSAAGAYLNDVWSSQDGTNWTQVTASAAWAARAGMGVVVTSNGMFILGGQIGPASTTNDVWFSADGETWSKVSAAAGWSARGFMGAVSLNNTLFVFGGVDAATATYFNDCWSSPDGLVWTQLTAAAFASARASMGVVVYNNEIWALGGGGPVSPQFSDVYSTTDGITWTLVTNTPGWAARQGCGAAVFSSPTPLGSTYQTLWVLGGIGAGSTNDIWAATLNTKIATTVPLAPGSFGQPYQFASFNNAAQLLIKNQSNLWVYGGGEINQVTDVGYPVTTVPGIVVLGGFVYVMDPTGLISNSALNDPTYWPSLNVIGADYEDDLGVALVKYLNYVVAFGQYTTQFFYDAGLQFGSPLAPYLNANMAVGCADAASVARIGANIAWVSNTREGRRQVMVFNGFAPQPISNAFVEKFLDSEISFRAFACTMLGQQLYILTLDQQQITWVYSFVTQQWYEFQQGFNGFTSNVFDFAGYATDLATTQFLQSASGVRVYEINDFSYDDATFPFQVYLRTDKFDAGNNRRKFWGRLDVIGDQNPGIGNISYTDDDYQTFSTPRTVNMATTRPALFRMGSGRRRAFVYTQNDSNPMRLEALEQEWEQGQ